MKGRHLRATQISSDPEVVLRHVWLTLAELRLRKYSISSLKRIVARLPDWTLRQRPFKLLNEERAWVRARSA